MRRLILMTLSVCTLSFFLSGCCKRQSEIVYVKRQCPRLHIIEINKTKEKPFALEYKIEKDK